MSLHRQLYSEKKSYAAAINTIMRLVPHLLIPGVFDNAFAVGVGQFFGRKDHKFPVNPTPLLILTTTYLKQLHCRTWYRRSVRPIGQVKLRQWRILLYVYDVQLIAHSNSSIWWPRTERSCAIMAGQVCNYSGLPIWVHVVVVVRLSLTLNHGSEQNCGSFSWRCNAYVSSNWP